MIRLRLLTGVFAVRNIIGQRDIYFLCRQALQPFFLIPPSQCRHQSVVIQASCVFAIQADLHLAEFRFKIHLSRSIPVLLCRLAVDIRSVCEYHLIQRIDNIHAFDPILRAIIYYRYLHCILQRFHRRQTFPRLLLLIADDHFSVAKNTGSIFVIFFPTGRCLKSVLHKSQCLRVCMQAVL